MKQDTSWTMVTELISFKLADELPSYGSNFNT